MNLNSTRFIAFLPVFFTHCFYSNEPAIKNHFIYQFIQNHLKIGLLSLDYFFVLSSFLISWIIYEEYEQSKKFNVLNFYTRRSLRIFPLYFLVVLFGFVVYYISSNFGIYELEKLPSFYHFLFFTLNFYMMKHGFGFLFFLTFFWSVSIEEQFYIFWALIMKFFKKYSLFVAIILIPISLIYRVTHLNNNNELVFHTFSSLSNFGIGCILGYLAFYKSNYIKYFNLISRKAKLLFYLLFLICLYYYNNIFSNEILVTVERLFFAVIFAFVITDLALSAQPTFNFEKTIFTNYFGRLSFGLYCYHGIVLTLAFKIAEHWHLTSQSIFVFGITPILGFAITLLLAHLSYKYFERPILNVKKKFI